MKAVWRVMLTAAAVLAAVPARAQDQPAAAAPAPAFELHGSADVGIRFTSVDGSRDSYRQFFDLGDGARVFALDLHGDAGKDAHAFADMFALSATGLGDPYSSVQFVARKSRRYDLRVNWRQNQWFSTWPLTPASIAGLDTQAVTDKHAWSTTRQMADAALTIDVSSRLHLQFAFNRVARDGSLDSTRSLDYIGSTTTWGSFARANPYAVISPIDESSNRATAGFSYGADRWSVHYRAGYATQRDSELFAPSATPERSINVADATTARELLTTLSYSQDRKLSGPISELSFVAQPHPRVEWRGEYLFARYEGPFSQNAAFAGTARTNAGGTTFSTYNITTSTQGDASAPNHVVTQGLTFALTDRWSADVRYRYSRQFSEGSGQLSSVLTGYPAATAAPISSSETDEFTWQQTLHALDLTTTIEPVPGLTIKPGVGLSQRDIEMRADGVVDPATSERIRSIWPELTAGYRPDPRFSVRGSYGVTHSDAWYTRLSPVDRTTARGVVKLQPIEGLTIDLNGNITDAELTSAAFVSHTRLGAAQAAYSLSDRLTLNGGFDVQSFLGVGSVSFLRGTAPISDDELNDREIDRVWQTGVTVKVTDRVGFTGTANFLSVTGTDTIAGEPALYGPATFPYATGSVWVDVPRLGRLTVDLQRTHWFQDLLPLNDFSARMLTIRYSRGF